MHSPKQRNTSSLIRKMMTINKTDVAIAVNCTKGFIVFFTLKSVITTILIADDSKSNIKTHSVGVEIEVKDFEKQKEKKKQEKQ